MRLFVVRTCSSILTPLCRGMAYYHIEWKPKPYPCTKAEREAAAKRYNLLPSDYKPFEDDGLAPGDYFYVEPYNALSRSPWEPYDFPRERRDFNDPQQFNAQMYLASGHNPEQLNEILKEQPLWYILFKTFAPFFGLWMFLYLGQMYCFFFPLVSTINLNLTFRFIIEL
ncbi:unnamed protein product [Schistosoma margrebowiei]|uniref:NADH dehydrogenase [ubiquinone] 1 beta subcomplex subunit 8, mitochondrial n=1 Tax=Schistosoma margrebowiei TaxID=48269 RepID=A0AA85AJN8_9TREM|nr:unnamed protein product [Schistosoma margrebowiei]